MVFFPFFRKWSFKSRRNPRVDFLRQEKTSKDSKRRFFIYHGWVLCWMDCLQLQFIRVEEAVSWTHRFRTRNIWPQIQVYLWQTNLKANDCKNSTFQVNRKKNATGRRRLTSSSYLEQPSRHFCQHFMRRTTHQKFLAINLASQQKTTKLYFFSQVRKQFKLLTVSFKPLGCCLRSDKLVNCHMLEKRATPNSRKLRAKWLPGLLP